MGAWREREGRLEPWLDLASGERCFHLIGAKSHGRSRSFMLQTGYAQLETVLEQLNQEA